MTSQGPVTPTPEPNQPEVVVRRSSRRRKTISARREGSQIVVLLPARLTAAQEEEWVGTMVTRVLAAEARKRVPASQDDLLRRATRLATEHLDPWVGRPVRPASVRWVTNQNRRWGSCTIDEGSIRLSSRLQGAPAWVVDYVLVHELAHLVEAHHTPRFRQLVARYPQADKAEGFLQGWVHASRQGMDPGDQGPQDEGLVPGALDDDVPDEKPRHGDPDAAH